MPWPLSMVGGDSLFRNSVRWQRGCPPNIPILRCFYAFIFFTITPDPHSDPHSNVVGIMGVEGVQLEVRADVRELGWPDCVSEKRSEKH